MCNSQAKRLLVLERRARQGKAVARAVTPVTSLLPRHLPKCGRQARRRASNVPELCGGTPPRGSPRARVARRDSSRLAAADVRDTARQRAVKDDSPLCCARDVSGRGASHAAVLLLSSLRDEKSLPAESLFASSTGSRCALLARKPPRGDLPRSSQLRAVRVDGSDSLKLKSKKCGKSPEIGIYSSRGMRLGSVLVFSREVVLRLGSVLVEQGPAHVRGGGRRRGARQSGNGRGARQGCLMRGARELAWWASRRPP